MSRVLVEALAAMGCDDECLVGYDATNPDAHDPHCARGQALRALAAHAAAPPLWERAELVEAVARAVNVSSGGAASDWDDCFDEDDREVFLRDAIAALRALAEYERATPGGPVRKEPR